MLEGMVRKHRMADFDVELDLPLEPEALQEAEHRRDIEIVLMLGRLLGLRLDQDYTLEPDLVLVVDNQGQKASELILLATQIGVEQRFVTLAAAPQHIIGAAELMRRVDGVLHLRGGVSEHVRIGIGRSAAHIAWMAEQIGGAPEKLGSALLHFLGKEIGHLGEVVAELLEALALGNDVAIVEGEERKAESREHLERGVRLEA